MLGRYQEFLGWLRFLGGNRHDCLRARGRRRFWLHGCKRLDCGLERDDKVAIWVDNFDGDCGSLAMSLLLLDSDEAIVWMS